ncbi:nuclear transport factor 2 family protein [Micromonospora sp. NBC_01655]|uniref:nuclear transport factor 2 family protein n=1 Tax=Micromonospora sp. NBC_01655 TaxID=2975983 RepID=UPI002253D719|nr:nuclear transport factor 2 family protein [Micromonospora sp. NBC_01655]MCX4471530.1 nuclear transport factor 2 family protein [Micromonospora sp. NBC_01655]
MTVDDLTAAITDMYRSLGDRAAFDARLHPELTIWESDAPDLLDGLAALDDLRDRRAATRGPAAPPTSVAPEQFRAEAWEDTGLVRYVLRARYATGRPDDCFRVTDVLRRDERGWRIVHHHAEALR